MPGVEHDLGASIRAHREAAGLSLREAAAQVAMSRSTLHRTELGARLLTSDDVAAIDVGLGLQGRLAEEYHLRQFTDEMEAVAARPLWIHAFPPAWHGPVWAAMHGPDHGTVKLTIDWGPWTRRCSIDRHRPLVLVFGQGVVEESVPLRLATTPPAVVTFGFGRTPVGMVTVDINDGWQYSGTIEEALARIGRTFERLLSEAGRDVADLAALLDVPEAELRRVLHLHDRTPEN